MAEATTMTISVKGFDTVVKFGPLAIQLVTQELGRLQVHDPQNYYAIAEQVTTPLIAYCGYYNHCHDNDFPPIFTFEDFLTWNKGMMLVHEGRQVLAKIYLLYVKSDPFYARF